jgi:hypothetical protein
MSLTGLPGFITNAGSKLGYKISAQSKVINMLE